jgi:hypothetical protein
LYILPKSLISLWILIHPAERPVSKIVLFLTVKIIPLL